jgi:hypothetical protein
VWYFAVVPPSCCVWVWVWVCVCGWVWCTVPPSSTDPPCTSWCLSVTFQLKAQAIAAGVSARQAWLGARALDALHVPTVQAFMQNKHPPVPCLRPGGGGGGSPRDKGSCARNSPKIFPLDKKNFSLGGIFDGPPVRSDPGSHLPTGIGRTSAAVR